MKTKYLIIISLLIFQSSCDPLSSKKCDGNSYLGFNFIIPIKITPSFDTLKIGDTLWIESYYNTYALNTNNNKYYDVSKVDFGVQMGINILSTNPTVGILNPLIIDSIGHANLINISAGTLINHKYELANDSMKIKYGWVLQSTGGFTITFFEPNKGRHWQETGQHITECQNEYLDLDYVTNNNADNGYDIYKNAPDTNFSKLSKSDYVNSGTYSVYVKP